MHNRPLPSHRPSITNAIAFVLALGFSSTALAAPDAKVAPRDTSKSGFAWKDHKDPIGSGAEKSQHNSSPYLIYRPAKGSAAKNRVVVFLHGSGGAPAGYTTIMEFAAAQGFHVIGLSYPMAGNIGNLCKASSADTPACPGAFREEVWSGAAKSPLTDVSTHPQDAIHNRIYAVLHYLADNPSVAGAGWNAFIDGDGKVAWSKLVIAGHSLGSGYAAYVAGQKKVDRVVMISGPGESCDTGKCLGSANIDPLTHAIVPSTWLVGEHATDAKAYFALAHTNDINDEGSTIPRIEKIRNAWNALGIPHGERTIDGMTAAQIKALSSAPHRLLSSFAVWDDPKTAPADQQRQAHGGVAGNADHYREIWLYLLTAPK
jgi:hypothetical protein